MQNDTTNNVGRRAQVSQTIQFSKPPTKEMNLKLKWLRGDERKRREH